VFNLLPSELEKLISARAMLETSALQSRMRRNAFGLGHTFHGDNRFLASCYDSIDFRFRALRNRPANRPWINVRTTIEHRALAELVGGGHVRKAKALLSKHLRAATSDYDQLLREHAKLQ
jgi:DNA-binding GntR family transcriptional regulator